MNSKLRVPKAATAFRVSAACRRFRCGRESTGGSGAAARGAAASPPRSRPGRAEPPPQQGRGREGGAAPGEPPAPPGRPPGARPWRRGEAKAAPERAGPAPRPVTFAPPGRYRHSGGKRRRAAARPPAGSLTPRAGLSDKPPAGRVAARRRPHGLREEAAAAAA